MAFAAAIVLTLPLRTLLASAPAPTEALVAASVEEIALADWDAAQRQQDDFLQRELQEEERILNLSLRARPCAELAPTGAAGGGSQWLGSVRGHCATLCSLLLLPATFVALLRPDRRLASAIRLLAPPRAATLAHYYAIRNGYARRAGPGETL